MFDPLERLIEFRQQMVDAIKCEQLLSPEIITDIMEEIIQGFRAKKAACCAAKASHDAEATTEVKERWIWVTKCRDCPHIRHSRWEPSYCIDTETIIVKDSEILPYCKLPKTPTRRKAGEQ